VEGVDEMDLVDDIDWEPEPVISQLRSIFSCLAISFNNLKLIVLPLFSRLA